MDTYQNPSLLGFQILLCLDFICFFAWISGEPKVNQPKVHQPKVHQGSPRFTTNPSKEAYEIQAKKDLKSKQKRILISIHANKYPLGHVTN